MIQINQLNVKLEHSIEDVRRKAARMAGCSLHELQDFQIVKRSIDARKKPEIYISYSVRFRAGDEKKILRKKDGRIQSCEEKEYKFLVSGEHSLKHRPVIVGMGPAGLFCGYFLAKHGYKPILLERGCDVERRTADVAEFWKGGALKANSNVQFGEGGAGTFSDGKLNTLIKDKDGRNKAVLQTFVDCGAPEEILYDAKPHIGTDVLSRVVKTMRQRIISWGGEVRFENQVVDIILEDNRMTGLVICKPLEKEGGKEPLKEFGHFQKEILNTSTVILAIGHSARDTFAMLYEKKIPMEAKAFAVGFRVQHPQTMVNFEQYGMEEPELLPAAPYKVTARTTSGRGVYSFCMCPGGYVVNASSEAGRLVVNGMSYSDRGGRNANSAIIVNVTPRDYGDAHPLAGIAFQRRLEEKAFALGKGEIPCQYYGDYKARVLGIEQEVFDKSITPQMRGKYCFADITEVLTRELNGAFVEGMEHFGKVMKGFNRPDAILAAIESRTSSPVRILRDAQMQSQIRGLYPCGEGAGYAGGITSAAMDGLRVAEQIASFYKPLDECQIF